MTWNSDFSVSWKLVVYGKILGMVLLYVVQETKIHYIVLV